MKINIVGCGLSGITAAIVLKEQGHQVEIFESRQHIGGNCYDTTVNNVNMHVYGPHMFHTNDDQVWEFLNQYTKFNNFKNRPLGDTEKYGLISLPYSKKTIKQIGEELTPEEIVNTIFVDYSEKQWNMPWSEIPKSITGRIPKVAGEDDPTWYEGEKYQGVPEKGYTVMMNNMLDGIKVHLGCDKDEWKKYKCDKVIYTGKIDDFFNCQWGELPYRSLRFEHRTSTERLSNPIINQCNKKPYTRTYDHAYFLNEDVTETIITKEYPQDYNKKNVPYYPIPFGQGQEIYKNYKTASHSQTNTIFLGRLATYKYLDMWMSIKQAMVKLNFK